MDVGLLQFSVSERLNFSEVFGKVVEILFYLNNSYANIWRKIISEDSEVIPLFLKSFIRDNTSGVLVAGRSGVGKVYFLRVGVNILS